MIFRPKGRDDCCCKSWKDKINELWEKYQGVVKGVKAGSVTAYPDGDGIADLDGAVADAIAQQVPPMLTDLVTETELSTALEDYPTETDLAQTLEDYATQQDLETKQDVLVSGQTIRTINGRDLLGEGNLQFNDVLPDFSQAAEGDALVIGSEGLPEWGEVDPLPDTTEASAGDVLTLDADKKPSWAPNIPGWRYNSYVTLNTGSNIPAEPGTRLTTRVNLPSTNPDHTNRDYLLVPYFDYNTDVYNVVMLGGRSVSAPTISSHSINYYNVGTATIPLSTRIGRCLIYDRPRQLDSMQIIQEGAANIISIIPPCSSADAGKVLSVTADGTLAWITPS